MSDRYIYNRDCHCGGCRAYGWGKHINPPPPAGDYLPREKPKPVTERPQERPQPFTPEQVDETIREWQRANMPLSWALTFQRTVQMLADYRARLLAEREAQR